MVGLAGAVAWTRGSIGEAIVGYARLLATEGGHLVAAVAMAAWRPGCFRGRVRRRAAPTAQCWVLNAADSYAHFVTLPVGLWALAAAYRAGRTLAPDRRTGSARQASIPHRDRF